MATMFYGSTQNHAQKKIAKSANSFATEFYFLRKYFDSFRKKLYEFCSF